MSVKERFVSLNIAISPTLPITIITSSIKQPPVNSVLLGLISHHRMQIMDLLFQHGAVLFRGFSCQDVEYFSAVIEACGLGQRCSTHDYKIPRSVFTNNIYTSSDFPGNVSIPMHHEKPRSKNPPNHIYFCCATAAEQGGETLFSNAQVVWEHMIPSIKDKLLKHGIVYKQYFHGASFIYRLLKYVLGRKQALLWTEYFSTSETMEIEKQLTLEEVNWEWIHSNRDLLVFNKLPGALNHPLTQKPLWFNCAGYLNYYSILPYLSLTMRHTPQYLASRYLVSKDMLPLVCHYGNGEAFSVEEIATINRVLQQHTAPLLWQQGDFMVVDNFTWMHGKSPHQGKRLLYSCMTKL